MKKSLLFLFSFYAASGMALISSKIKLEGYVTSFDNDKVTVESGSQRIEVPRKFYQYKVKAGERISIEMDTKDLDGFKKETIQPAKK